MNDQTTQLILNGITRLEDDVRDARAETNAVKADIGRLQVEMSALRSDVNSMIRNWSALSALLASIMVSVAQKFIR